MLSSIIICALYVITYIFVYLAGKHNAAMDAVSDHYSTSIFSTYNEPEWFDRTISWRNKYIDGDQSKGKKTIVRFGIKFYQPDAFSDFWHYAKFKMLMSISFGLVSFFIASILLGHYYPLKISVAIILPFLYILFPLVFIKSFNYWYEKGFKKHS